MLSPHYDRSNSHEVHVTQGAIIAGVVTSGLICLVVLSMRARDQPIGVGIWFEDLSGGDSDALTGRLDGVITAHDLKRIESTAHAELRTAFSNSRLTFSDSRTATYRLRVLQRFGTGPRALLPAAGASRSVPGLGGEGAINFEVIASSAISYAPVGTTRDGIIAAIGRGIGRTAAHELAHQILGSFSLHQTTDRLSYEYADLRPEHFYGIFGGFRLA